MTDTPDLRTIAAEATPDEIRAAHWQPSDLAAAEAYHAAVNAKPCEHWKGSPDDGYRTCIGCYVDAALAVYEPAHRRQVLAGAIAAVEAYRLDGRGLKRGVASGLDKAIEVVRRLASAAPETAPRPRHDDETAPAVGREAPEAQKPAQAFRTWLAEVHDGTDCPHAYNPCAKCLTDAILTAPGVEVEEAPDLQIAAGIQVNLAGHGTIPGPAQIPGRISIHLPRTIKEQK